MNQDAVLTFIKGLAGVLSAIGIAVSPEDAATIGMGFWALYGVIQAFRAYIKTKTA